MLENTKWNQRRSCVWQIDNQLFFTKETPKGRILQGLSTFIRSGNLELDRNRSKWLQS